MTYRPSWIVLTPGTLRAIAPIAKTVTQIWPAFHRVRGRRGYTAIAELEPGAQSTYEHELATALSKNIAGRHYVLDLAPYAFDPDHGTDAITVYEDGKARGRVAIVPAGRLATHYGCAVPNLDAADAEPVDPAELELIAPRKTRKGDPELFGIPLAHLADAIEEDDYGTSLMLAEATPKQFAAAVAALDHANATARRVAAIGLAECSVPTAEWIAAATCQREREADPQVRSALDDLVEAWEDCSHDEDGDAD
jgi:hypothetical protein